MVCPNTNIVLDIQPLTARCEFVAEWRHNGSQEYLKVMSPSGYGLDGGSKNIPLLLVRPSQLESDIIDVKTVYYDWNDLPPFTTFESLPFQLSDSGRQNIMVDGKPFSIDSLTELAFKTIRSPKKNRHVFDGLIQSTVMELPIIQDQRFANTRSRYCGRWIDPEVHVDSSFNRLKLAPLLNEPLDLKDLLTIKVQDDRFYHYRSLDTSPVSQEIRLLSMKIPETTTAFPTEFQFQHISLADGCAPPFVLIECTPADYDVSGRTDWHWKEVTIDDREFILSPVVASGLLQLPNIVKQAYGGHPGTEILFFLPRLCVDIYNVDETAHYKRVFDKLMRCGTCTVQFFDGLTNAAVSRFNRTAGGIYAPLDRTSREIRLLLLQSSK